MFCKTIILSNSENLTNNAPKGILTLSKENNHIKGKIRLYNLSTLPTNTKIGLYVDEKVYTSAITKKPQHYEFDLNENIDITQSIYCALIDNSNNLKNVLLEGGSFNGFYFTDSPLDAVLEAKDKQLEQTIDNALQQVATCDNCNCKKCDCENCEYKKYFYEHYNSSDQQEYQTQKNNNQTPDNYILIDADNININLGNVDLENRDKTEEFNFNNDNPFIKNIAQNKTETNLETSPSNLNKKPINNFQAETIEKLENELINEVQHIAPFNDVDVNNLTGDIIEEAEQLIINDENMDNSNISPQENAKDTPQQSSNTTTKEQTDFLNDIIYQLDEMFKNHPEDETLNSIIPNSRFIQVTSEKPYVLGVIYEDNQLKYIAYGVPASYNSLPPVDFAKHYQWLPLNPKDVMSDGYFMIYQDAITGTLVEIEFEE